MPNPTDTTDSSRLRNSTTPSNQAKLDRIANEAAGLAAKREQRYDQDHGIFTK